MARYAKWYSVELDGYLKGRISDAARFEATKEVSSHIAEHMDELIDKGMDPIEAEKAAIKSFGTPRKAALNLLGNSPYARIGNFISGVSAVSLSLFIATSVLFMYASTFQLLEPSSRFVGDLTNYKVVLGIGIFSLISMVIGSVLMRRVPIKRFVCSWAIGIVVTGFFCLCIGKPNYARVPPEKLEASIQGWKGTYAKTLELAEIDKNIRHRLSISHSYRDKEDKPAFLALISSDAPKLLAGRGLRCVDVVGKDTSGYLVPQGQIGPNNIGFRYWNRDGFEDRTIFASLFPTMVYYMSYEPNPDKAIEAWRTGSSMYFSSRESPLDHLAATQFNFIASAEHLSKASPFSVMFDLVGFTALATGLYLITFLGGCWILVRMSMMTFQSSFRRRIA